MFLLSPEQYTPRFARLCRTRCTDLAAILLPLSLFILNGLPLRHWVIDDAGISFAYARNLAAGHGLTSQPHAPPVEGYSNFLWVVCLALFYKLRIFDIVATPKLLSLSMIAGAFALLYGALTRNGGLPKPLVSLALGFTAAQPAFCIWCYSGLENALTIFLLSLLFSLVLWDFTSLERRPSAALLGLVSALVALNRPDGIIYGLVTPGLTLVRIPLRWNRAEQHTRRRLVTFTGVYGGILGLFEAFRLLYFHALLPNTYYAKEEDSPFVRVLALIRLRGWMLHKFWELPKSIAGGASVWLMSVLAGATLVLIVRRKVSPAQAACAVFLLLATCAYLLLPGDWMPEFRFATPFYLFFPLYTLTVVHAFAKRMSAPAGEKKSDVRLADSPPSRSAGARFWKYHSLCLTSHRVIGIVGLTLFAAANTLYQARIRAFSQSPPVPLQEIAKQFGTRYNLCADLLGPGERSLLLPDMGGTLLTSRLRVYDLGMLCDRTITRTIQKHPGLFYDYIFRQVKPTFIHTHGFFAKLAHLDGDVRFRRDYLAIQEHPDPYVAAHYGQTIYSGDYVRRDATAGRSTLIAALRAVLSRSPREIARTIFPLH